MSKFSFTIFDYSDLIIPERDSSQRRASKLYSTLQEIVYHHSREFIVSEDDFMLYDPKYVYSKKHDKNALSFGRFDIHSRKDWLGRKKDYGLVKLFNDGSIEITSYCDKFNEVGRHIMHSYYKKHNKNSFISLYYD